MSREHFNHNEGHLADATIPYPFFGYPSIGAALRGGADVPITTSLNSVTKTAISTIADDAWTPIRYTNALYDHDTEQWISVAEIPFTAFASEKKATTSPAGWSCAASRTYDRRKTKARASCSTSGASTPSQPPPTPASSTP